MLFSSRLAVFFINLQTKLVTSTFSCAGEDHIQQEGTSCHTIAPVSLLVRSSSYQGTPITTPCLLFHTIGCRTCKTSSLEAEATCETWPAPAKILCRHVNRAQKTIHARRYVAVAHSMGREASLCLKFYSNERGTLLPRSQQLCSGRGRFKPGLCRSLLENWEDVRSPN